MPRFDEVPSILRDRAPPIRLGPAFEWLMPDGTPRKPKPV